MAEFGRTSGSPENEDFDRKFAETFEQELRAGLRVRSAPEGFADRVLARVEKAPEHAPFLRAIRKPLVRGSIAATLLLALGTGAYVEHQRERQIAGEHARQQVLLALRITSITIRDIRNPIDRDRSEHRNRQETP